MSDSKNRLFRVGDCCFWSNDLLLAIIRKKRRFFIFKGWTMEIHLKSGLRLTHGLWAKYEDSLAVLEEMHNKISAL